MEAEAMRWALMRGYAGMWRDDGEDFNRLRWYRDN
jgi:hypothetical protein